MPYDSCFYCADTPCSPPLLPAGLAALGPRQKEIASIVYLSASATARDVQSQLSELRSERVIRTLLDRMVNKGILKRRFSGRHHEIIYLPAVATASVKEAAINRLVNEHFRGSLGHAARAIAALAEREKQVPRSPVALKRLVGGHVGGSGTSSTVGVACS